MTPKSAEEVASGVVAMVFALYGDDLEKAHGYGCSLFAKEVVLEAIRAARREALLDLAIIINEVSRCRFRDAYAALSWAEVEARAIAASEGEG